MQLPRFSDDTSDADKTTEYRGRVETVEVLTDVTMELLPDDTGALPRKIAAALATFPPVAIDTVRSTAPTSTRSPDASLEFPNPLRPELFADATSELRVPDFDDDDVLPVREPPRWRLFAFAGAMVAAATLVGFGFAGRSRVSTVEETPTAAKAPPITRSTINLPDPASVGTATKTTATATTTTAATTTTTATVTAAAPTTTANPPVAKEKIGLLVTPLWAKGRNVWVDGVIFGVSPKVEAACGKHVVKVGDKGKARSVNIPCGGKVVVAP